MYKIFPEKQKTRPCVRITELKYISWALIRKQKSDLIERWRGWCYRWGWCYPGARTGRDWSRDRAACSRVWLLTNTDSRRREKAPQNYKIVHVFCVISAGFKKEIQNPPQMKPSISDTKQTPAVLFLFNKSALHEPAGYTTAQTQLTTQNI